MGAVQYVGNVAFWEVAACTHSTTGLVRRPLDAETPSIFDPFPVDTAVCSLTWTFSGNESGILICYSKGPQLREVESAGPAAGMDGPLTGTTMFLLEWLGPHGVGRH
jgi:hypothetical protein